MRIDHRRTYIVVAEQLLHGADVVSCSKPVRCETVPKLWLVARFAINHIWKANGAETECKNFFVELANFFQMIDSRRFQEFGEGSSHGRSSVGFRLASPTRIREVKKSQAIRRKSEFALCAK